MSELIKNKMKNKNYDETLHIFSMINLMEYKPNDIFFNKQLDYINKKNCNLKITEIIQNIMITNKIKASLQIPINAKKPASYKN